MEIIDAIKKHKGKPFMIPDCSRDDLPEFFVKMGYKVGAEIGIYKGAYTKKFLEVGLKMYGIDPWLAYESYRKRPAELRLKNKSKDKFQKRQDFLYGHAQRSLKNYIASGLCELVRKTSMEAVNDFEDESLDFVYIDGNHGFRYVAEDLCEWTPKIKKGGVISGHDYTLNKKTPRDPYVLQVKYVLHAFVDAYEIKNWYVLGRTSPKGERVSRSGKYYNVYINKGKEEKRDKWRSWFWIK